MTGQELLVVLAKMPPADWDKQVVIHHPIGASPLGTHTHLDHAENNRTTIGLYPVPARIPPPMADKKKRG